MRKIVYIFFVLLVAVMPVYGLNQADVLHYHAGAFETGQGSSVGNVDNNLASGFYNPGALATIQQLKFSTMLGDILGKSRVFYFSSGIPTKRGVLGFSFRSFGADDNTLLDRAMGGNIMWAKDFTDNFYAGLGLRFMENWWYTNKRPSIAADIGVIYKKTYEHSDDQVSFIRSFSFGGALINMGNFIKNTNGDVISTPWIMRVGPSLDMAVLSSLDMTASLDLMLVNFTKFRFNIGVQNRIADNYFFNIGYMFNSDLSYINMGLAYQFKIKEIEGRVSLAWMPLIDGGGSSLFAGFDTTIGSLDTAPPVVVSSFAGEQEPEIWVSPNFDGKQDMVELELKIKDNKQLEGWQAELIDEKGRVVKTYGEQFNPFPGKLTFGRVWTRMWEKAPEPAVPDTIEWGGKDDSGQLVPDGSYKLVVSAWDKNNNRFDTPPSTVHIDMTSPTAEVKSDLTLFSPNNDGAKDFLTITQDTTGDDFWTGEMRNADGEVVRSFTWENRTPERTLVWDGKDENGKVVANGVYAYFLMGRDKAGNEIEKKLINISLTTNKQTAVVDADLDAFSPNADGRKDVLIFRPALSSVDGLTGWEVAILDEVAMLDEKENPVRTFTGASVLPPEIEWDGADETGTIVPDGNYYYRFQAQYDSGNHPASFVKALSVDSTAPEVKTGLSTELFSPDNDGKDDQVEFSLDVSDPSGIKDWKLKIRNEDGEIVRIWEGQGKPASRISWNGVKDDSSLVQGGEIYSVELEMQDEVGNRIRLEPQEISIDSTPPEIMQKSAYKIFSPDGDGEADLQVFMFNRNDKKQLKQWEMVLMKYDRNTQEEIPVKTWTGTNLVESISWDGYTEDGTLVQGGEIYRTYFTAVDVLGNKVSLKDTFAVDTTPPFVAMKLDPELFSPDDDGQDDSLMISLAQKDKKNIADWKVDIYPVREEGRGALFQTFTGTIIPEQPLEWDGISLTGELVESAQEYEVEFTVTDLLGNSTSVVNILEVDILVIRTPYGWKIKISNIGFEYNKADLTGDRTFTILKKIVKLLKRNNYMVEVNGHTDNSGSEAYNLNLSQERAQSVMEYMIKHGIPAARLRSVGRGEAYPVADNTTPEGQAKNRRVEFLLFKEGWPAEEVPQDTPDIAPSPEAIEGE